MRARRARRAHLRAARGAASLARDAQRSGRRERGSAGQSIEIYVRHAVHLGPRTFPSNGITANRAQRIFICTHRPTRCRAKLSTAPRRHHAQRPRIERTVFLEKKRAPPKCRIGRVEKRTSRHTCRDDVV
eukprot:2190524-Pyramimonas_sp.AAC.1